MLPWEAIQPKAGAPVATDRRSSDTAGGHVKSSGSRVRPHTREYDPDRPRPVPKSKPFTSIIGRAKGAPADHHGKLAHGATSTSAKASQPASSTIMRHHPGFRILDQPAEKPHPGNLPQGLRRKIVLPSSAQGKGGRGKTELSQTLPLNIRPDSAASTVTRDALSPKARPAKVYVNSKEIGEDVPVGGGVHEAVGSSELSLLNSTFPASAAADVSKRDALKQQPLVGSITWGVRKQLAPPPSSPHNTTVSPARKTPSPNRTNTTVNVSQIPMLGVVDATSCPVVDFSLQGEPSGVAVSDLLPTDMLAIDLKQFDIHSEVPKNTVLTNKPPRIKLSTTAVECRVGDSLQVIINFCRTAADVEEVNLDRALQYHVYCDRLDVFDEPPSVDVEGTLTFKPAEFVFGRATVYVRASDNATVPPKVEELLSSDVQQFTVSIHSLPHTQTKLVDWKSHQSKIVADVAVIGDEDKNVYREVFRFPMTNIHAMRGKHEATQDSIQCVRITSPVSFIEKIRMVPLLHEFSNLVGGTREFEQLSPTERIEYERTAAADYDNMVAEVGLSSEAILPAAVKLAQVYASSGSVKQEEAVEMLTVVISVRLGMLGLETFDVVAADGSSLLQPPSAEIASKEDIDKFYADVDALAHSFFLLGVYLKYIGRFSESVEQFQYALQTTCLFHDEESVPAIRTMMQVGEVHLIAGNYDEALECFIHCTNAAEVAFGSEEGSVSTQSVLHMLGYTQAMVGDFVSSTITHQRVLKARMDADAAEQAQQGRPGSWAYLLTESHMFITHSYLQEGKLEDALHFANEGLEIIEQFDVDMNLDYSVTQCMLISVLVAVHSARGSMDMARSYALRAMDEIPNDAGVGFCRAVLQAEVAALLLRQERSAARESSGDVVKLLRSACEVMALLFGKSHVISARTTLLAAFIEPDVDEAEKYDRFQEIASLCMASSSAIGKALHPSHFDIAAVCEAVGDALIAVHRYDEAFSTLMKGVKVMAAKTPNSAPDSFTVRLMSRACCAMCYSGAVLGDADVELFVRAVKFQILAHGEWDLGLIPIYQNLAEVHFMRGEVENSRLYLSKAVTVADKMKLFPLLGELFKPASQLTQPQLNQRNKIATRKFDTELTPLFCRLLYAMGGTFEKEQRIPEAESTFLQGLAVLELANDTESISAVLLFCALGRLLFTQGLFGDALAYMDRAFVMLSDHHPTEQEELKLVAHDVSVIHAQTSLQGYLLQRHTDTDFPFPVYL